jgi:hypothetical protein
MTLSCWEFNGWKFKGWAVCAIALASFASGSLITARLLYVNRVSADNNRVFESPRLSCFAGQIASAGATLSRYDFKAARQTRS